jgi:hypothetical protein
VLCALLGVLAAACVPEPPPPSVLQVSVEPALYPAFSADVSDYVVRCTDDPVQVTIDTADGTSVAVAGQPPQTGHFVASVTRSTGQSFTIVDQPATASEHTFHVRCLPLDFFGWTASRTGETQAEYYLMTPYVGPFSYAAIYDHNGVPIWWAPPTDTIFAKLFANGDVAWTKMDGTAGEERTLGGTLVTAIESDDGVPELHDILRLDNGNYVIVVNQTIPGVDFSAWGADAPADGTAPLANQILQEVKPDGEVVWEWNVHDHIPVSETDPQWYWSAQQPNPGIPVGDVDAYHWNSVDPTPTGYLLSFRHLDAVIHVNRATGEIDWKLGGTPVPGKSLDVIGDPVFDVGSHFGGQHDARLLPDGTVTVYDNGSNLGRTGRAVRYQVSFFGTATMLEQRTDPNVALSLWGGSARRLSGGNWVIAFGGTDTVAEYDGNGNRVFEWKTSAGLYRAVPVEPGVLSREALRAGMDAQYPVP